MQVACGCHLKVLLTGVETVFLHVSVPERGSDASQLCLFSETSTKVFKVYSGITLIWVRVFYLFKFRFLFFFYVIEMKLRQECVCAEGPSASRMLIQTHILTA